VGIESCSVLEDRGKKVAIKTGTCAKGKAAKDLDQAVPLQTVSVLNAASHSPVNPVSHVFRENAHNAALLWPGNF
jgi:hypothetical protein